MEDSKKEQICKIVDAHISAFAQRKFNQLAKEKNDPDGVINAKKNNCFISALGGEFMYYSAFIRSFDSSFGAELESMANDIAKLSYTVEHNVKGFILPEQETHLLSIVNKYTEGAVPKVSDYSNFSCQYPADVSRFGYTHQVDHYFYNERNNTHYVIELKAGGDLDTKKAPSEKMELLKEYFIIKNAVRNDETAKVKLYFATAYNKYGEGNKWTQGRVTAIFAPDELLIGKDYWNFVCDDEDGFKVVYDQYLISAEKIKKAISDMKKMYF